MTDTALVQIETLKAVEVFAPGGVEKLVAEVEIAARALNKDIDATSPAGREQAKSLAYKVARSKTALDEMGKEFVAELKKASGKVDADRRILRDRLDTLRDEIRKPADEYDAREERRINNHVVALGDLLALETLPHDATIISIDERQAIIRDHAMTRNWEEFKDRADQLLARIPATLAAARDAAVKRKEEQAELERLRKAEAERVEAERAANAERERQEREERIAREAMEAADIRAAAAELRACQAVEQAIRDQTEAIERERQRIADIAAQEAAETARREANKAHRTKINREAAADLMHIAGLKEQQAKDVVTAIAQDKIRNLEIRY